MKYSEQEIYRAIQINHFHQAAKELKWRLKRQLGEVAKACGMVLTDELEFVKPKQAKKNRTGHFSKVCNQRTVTNKVTKASKFNASRKSQPLLK